jgi:hypothetical protein
VEDLLANMIVFFATYAIDHSHDISGQIVGLAPGLGIVGGVVSAFVEGAYGKIVVKAVGDVIVSAFKKKS